MTSLLFLIGGRLWSRARLTLYVAIGYGNEPSMARFLLYIMSDEDESDRELGEEGDWSPRIILWCSVEFRSPGKVGSNSTRIDDKRDLSKGGGRNGHD